MKPICDDTGRLLARFALDGRITLEALDQPTSSWRALAADQDAANRRAQRLGRALPYPAPLPWRNLAREWIQAHRQEWESLLLEHLNTEDVTPLPPLLP